MAAGGREKGTGPGAGQPPCSLPRTCIPTSAWQVSGNWFSVAQASKEPKLLWKDTDMMFFVHKICMTPRTMEFHLYRR